MIIEERVRAVEENLEYWRTKRLEPRIFHMARKGILTLYEILKASSSVNFEVETLGAAKEKEIESRVKEIEDALGEYVHGIGLIEMDLPKRVDMVIEDSRMEAGFYDDFWRIAKKVHHGSLIERVERLEQDLRNYKKVLDSFTQALLQKEFIDLKGKSADPLPNASNGARIVAKAWLDPTFKNRLVATGWDAIKDFGISPGSVGKLRVVENTEHVHNVIVCTLCSCYPYQLLGDNPWWYKHESYRTRIVEDPRGTLETMFGLNIPQNIEIRVQDSSSDLRYMVLPKRPSGTEGMSEEELAKLVTRDSLIGAGEPLPISQDRAKLNQ
ncbi:MAG: nitrile hydratase subunit alpha [Candidatus Bathyarchaeia archaeon]